MRTCYRCGECKDLSAFKKDKRAPLGVKGLCKACVNVEQKPYQAIYREYCRAAKASEREGRVAASDRTVKKARKQIQLSEIHQARGRLLASVRESESQMGV